MKLQFLGQAHFSETTAGKKATSLHLLLQAGFSVPAGFIIPDELSIDQQRNEIFHAVEHIGGFPVAVRSSSCHEDLPEASFAGQYISILNVTDADSLVAAVEQCRRSAKNENAHQYALQRGFETKPPGMNILIQKMIQPIGAGVCFTLHPLTGIEDHTLIECCSGLGEKLIGGLVAPTRYVLSISERKIINQEIGQDRFILPESILKQLISISIRVQAHFGAPQDIEWAYDESGLHILQSRPITSIQWRIDVEEFTNADFKDGGVSSRVCTPLMYSLYRDAMQISMRQYFIDLKLLNPKAPQEQWINCFYGRPYWNASAVKRRLSKIPGFSEDSFDADLGIRRNYGPMGSIEVPTNLKTIFLALPATLALDKCYARQIRDTEDYPEFFWDDERKWRARIEEFGLTPNEAFFTDLEAIMALHRKTESDYFTVAYYNSRAQSDFKKLVDKISQKTKVSISILNLISGLVHVSHLEVQSGLLKLFTIAKTSSFETPAWTAGLQEFLAENFFRGDSELDITMPRWGEDPSRIKVLVEEMIKSNVAPLDPQITAQEQNAQFIKERTKVEDLFSRSFFLRILTEGSFKKQLDRARVFLVRREAMREVSIRCYYLVRQYFIEAGKRFKNLGWFDSVEDVFMLQTEDILEMIHGQLSDATIKNLVAFRKLRYRGFRNLLPPNELGQGALSRAKTTAILTKGDRCFLKGTGCSAGFAEGPVRIIRNLEEASQLQKGEILVTQFTGPGWMPILGISSGFIAEVGGLLSHAAIIGRELGIPAVLNLSEATTALKTGQRVRLDGEKGIVEILSESTSVDGDITL